MIPGAALQKQATLKRKKVQRIRRICDRSNRVFPLAQLTAEKHENKTATPPPKKRPNRNAGTQPQEKSYISAEQTSKIKRLLPLQLLGTTKVKKRRAELQRARNSTILILEVPYVCLLQKSNAHVQPNVLCRGPRPFAR